MCNLSFFSRKQPSTAKPSITKPSLPKELLVVEDTVKLAMKPWKDFVTVEDSSSVLVESPFTNIVTKEYIPDMASAFRVANVILQTVKHEIDPSIPYSAISGALTRTDNGMFWHQSAVNILASTLYYFVHKFPYDGYGEEDHVDLPHVLAFLQLYTPRIMEVLETCPAISFAMLPYQRCYKNKAIDLLENMLSEAFVYLAPLATRENMWLMGGSKGKGHFLMQPMTDVPHILDTNYMSVQKDVRDYADYLLGIREKPIETAIIDDEPISATIPDDILVVDEPYASEVGDLVDAETYARVMEKRYGFVSDLDTD